MGGKRDNTALAAKVAARVKIAEQLPDSAAILELFAGQGVIFHRAWKRFRRGACLDLVDAKVDRAARHRPTWAVYRADAEVALRHGWMAHVPFDVVDIDAYGEPWKFLRAWCLSTRSRAPTTHIVATDGWLSKRSISAMPIALFGEQPKGLPPGRPSLTERYCLDTARDAVTRWTAERGGTLRHFATKRANTSMFLHYLIVDYPTSES